MKILLVLLVLFALVFIVYVLGPSPTEPKFGTAMPQLPGDMAKLEEYVTKNESMHKLKRDNEARIVWYNDVMKSKTEYAVVYLHGFRQARQRVSRYIETSQKNLVAIFISPVLQSKG